MRSFLLIPCLLICLACATATPFPVENLEEGMTPLEVRESVGEPGFIASNGVWMYTHEERNWAGFVARNDVFLHFEDERLFHWQVTEPISSEGAYQPEQWNSSTDQWNWSRDATHHKKGHTHHHGHK